MYDSIWLSNYNLLKKYYDENNNIDVPIDYVVNKIRLGLWLYNQRQCFKGAGGKKISKERVELLNKLGMKWNYREDNWNIRFELLKEYKEKNGDTNVPSSYIVNDIDLGAWVRKQRVSYNSGKLIDEKINKLNEIGMIWSFFDNMWNINYDLLKKYYDIHGNIKLPVDYRSDDKDLYAWLINQKLAKKDNLLTDEQIAKLDFLGIVWDNSKANFESKLELLEMFKEEHGHVDVPKNYKVDSVNLGSWVDGIRQAYTGHGNYLLTSEMIKELDNIGFIWNIGEYHWNKKYEILKDFFNKYGDINVSGPFIFKGVDINSWLLSQRSTYKKGNLSDDKIVKLNAIGIDWSLSDTKKLNKPVTSANKDDYRLILLKRVKSVLSDLAIEEKSIITSKEEQKRLEEKIIKKIFR